MGCTKKYNKTLVDLARQSKIITGTTACFDGKIQAGIPFSGYPTGVDMTTLTNVGISSPSLTCVFSGNSFTTLFDVSNPTQPGYNPIFDVYSGYTWSGNPIFNIYTSGLTLPITVYSALTQTVGPILFPASTGMTGDHPIVISYTGFSIQYSFSDILGLPGGDFTPSSPPGTGFTSGFTSALQIFYTASSLDYRGPLDYLSSKENATISNKLTTKKLKVTGGASSGTIGNVLRQVDEFGTAEWSSGFTGTSADTNTFVVSGTFPGAIPDTLVLNYNIGGSVPDIDLSSLRFSGGSGNCINDLFITNLHGCSPITFHSSLQHIGSSATGLNSIAWGSGNTSSDNFSSILGGQFNSITGNSVGCENNTIVGGSNNTMSDFGTATSDNNTILGGLSNTMSARSLRSAIIGGTSNIIGVSGGTTANSVIVGGTSNIFPGLTPANNSVILGGTGITGLTGNTVYMNNLEVTQGNALIEHDHDSETKLIIQNFDVGTSANSLLALLADGTGGVNTTGFLLYGGQNYTNPTGTFQGNYITNALNIGTGGGGPADRGDINIGSRKDGGQTRFFGGTGSDADDFNDTSLLGIFFTSGLTITDTLNTDKLRVRDGATNGFVLTSDSSGNATWAASTGGGSFSGGSGNCITDLFITNLHGCSPVTVYDNLQHISSSATGINSIAWGSGNTASGNYSYVEGVGNMSSGIASHAEGGLEVTEVTPFFSLSPTSATTGSAHAEGIGTLASGQGSHAEGKLTIASGHYSHAEGSNTQATGHTSHAEGHDTISSGNRTHAEGEDTEARGDWSHSQGKNTLASGSGSFASGRGQIGKVIAGGDYSFAHFRNNIFPSVDGGAMGDYSAILGGEDHNIGDDADSSGIFGGVGNVIATGVTRSVILGGVNITGTTVDTVYVPNLNIGTIGIGSPSINLGLDSSGNVVTGIMSGGSGTFTGNTSGDCINDLWVSTIHGCSPVTITTGIQSLDATAATELPVEMSAITTNVGTPANIAMGSGATAGYGCFAFGILTQALNIWSFAEGVGTRSLSWGSHAEGYFTTAGIDGPWIGENNGVGAHAEGAMTIAYANVSHAEGTLTAAYGSAAHVGGSGGLGIGPGDIIVASGDTSFVHMDQWNRGGHIGARARNSVILGGRDNDLGVYNTVYSTNFDTHSGGTDSGIFCGVNHDMYGDSSAIIGGSGNTINLFTKRSIIVGGGDNTINGGIKNSAIIGGSNITATDNDTVYVPNLDLCASSGTLFTNSISGCSPVTIGPEVIIDGPLTASTLSLGSGSNKWNDGYLGNDEFIAILPSDFTLSTDTLRAHGVYTDDNGATTKNGNAGFDYYALKIIPKGFTATDVELISIGIIGNVVTPYDGSIITNSVTAHVAGYINTVLALSPPVVGTGEEYIVIKFAPQAITNQIYGAKIYIERTT